AIAKNATSATALRGFVGHDATARIRRPIGREVASTWPVMITSAICIVKGMRSQNPRPQESTTSRTVDGVAARAATNTTTVAISAKTNASGTHRSVQSVSASAIRAIGPVASTTTGLSSTIVLGSVRSHPLRVERHLLHAPVVHVGDIQIVFSRARDG